MFIRISLQILLPLSLVSSSVAGLSARQSTTNLCQNFIGGFDTTVNFTLAAFNTTLPNANTTGAPLVLGQAGAIDGAQFEVLSTWASFPYNDWPRFSLKKSRLIAHQRNSSVASTVCMGARNGTEIGFVTTSLKPPRAPAVFCGIANTDPAGGGNPFPVLAINNNPVLFSLCADSVGPNAQVNVVYNATKYNDGNYDFDSCYPVVLHVVQ